MISTWPKEKDINMVIVCANELFLYFFDINEQMTPKIK